MHFPSSALARKPLVADEGSQKVNGPISTLRLNVLLHLHLAPIKQIVFLCPNMGKSNLEASFALNMLSALICSAL